MLELSRQLGRKLSRGKLQDEELINDFSKISGPALEKPPPIIKLRGIHVSFGNGYLKSKARTANLDLVNSFKTDDQYEDSEFFETDQQGTKQGS